MAITYLCTHYFVDTFTKFKEINQSIVKFEYDKTFASTTTQSITQSTTKTIDQIRFDTPRLYLDSTSKKLTHRYNLRNQTKHFYSQIMQDKILLHLLNTTSLNDAKASESGLFVEAGAYDGETWSNTLYLERFKNWTGLLIEPSAGNYRILRGKNRKSYSINNCLCPGGKSVNSSYIEAGPFGITTNSSSSVASTSSSSSEKPIYSITCHPLANIFDKFFSQFSHLKEKKSRISDSGNDDVIVIDYLSLDIEGSEKETIATFPFDRYRFNLLNIEFNQNKNVYNWVKSFLKKFGYTQVIVDDVWYQDMYLAHDSVLEKLNRDFSKVSQLFKK